MTATEQSPGVAMRQALQELRQSTAANLQAFNEAAPHASRLRRNEIKRFTVDLLWAVKRAPKRRAPSLFGKIGNVFSWITRANRAARRR
jgi:hypothetical protein